MEAILISWQLSFDVDRNPVYTSRFATEYQCLVFVGNLAREMPHREIVGAYVNGNCRLVIFPDRYELARRTP